MCTVEGAASASHLCLSLGLCCLLFAFLAAFLASFSAWRLPPGMGSQFTGRRQRCHCQYQLQVESSNPRPRWCNINPRVCQIMRACPCMSFCLLRPFVVTQSRASVCTVKMTFLHQIRHFPPLRGASGASYIFC